MNVSLRDQCYSHRLYGKTDELEDALAVFEQSASRLLATIMADSRLPTPRSPDHRLLLTFIAVQIVRTVSAHLKTRQMSSSLGKALFDDSAPPDWALSRDQTVSMTFSAAPSMGDTLMDLAMVLIRAPDNSRFVTSDNPVFRYNLYCEGITDCGVTGTMQRGLQIFLPLSPSLVVHLYDGGVYKVGFRKQKGAVDASADDVDQLNRLQLISANENVYFNERWLHEGLGIALAKVERIRERSGPRVNVAVSNDDSQDELVHQFWPMPQLGLKLSFIAIKRKPRRVPLTERINLVRPSYVEPRPKRSAPHQTYTIRRRI